MRPTHCMESYLLYSESVDFNVNLTWKIPSWQHLCWCSTNLWILEKEVRLNPFPSPAVCKSKGGQSWESQELWWVRVSWFGIWGVEFWWGFFLSFIQCYCYCLIVWGFCLFVLGFFFFFKEKKPCHFPESSAKRLKHETDLKRWWKKNKTLLSACLVLSPAHPINSSRTSETFLELSRNEFNVFGPYDLFMKCQRWNFLFFQWTVALPALKSTGAERIPKAGWPQRCWVCAASQCASWRDFQWTPKGALCHVIKEMARPGCQKHLCFAVFRRKINPSVSEHKN